MIDLNGKCAIVTGGGRGIGRSICSRLAHYGASVAVVDIREAEAAETCHMLEAGGARAVSIECDVSSPGDVHKMFDRVLESLDGLHILVNNAGITRDGLMVRMTDEQWDSVIGVNLKGTFNCCRAASKHFMKQRFGRIVNIASVVGLMGNAGQANYAASKAGIVGLTKSLAKELAARGVTANAVAPGFIDTEMTRAIPEREKSDLAARIPLGRLGNVADVANLVAFLVSDGANYITGQVINVDGGMVM